MKDNQKTVLMILKHLPPVYSGAGRQAMTLKRALALEGLGVRMMSMISREDLRLLNPAGLSEASRQAALKKDNQPGTVRLSLHKTSMLDSGKKGCKSPYPSPSSKRPKMMATTNKDTDIIRVTVPDSKNLKGIIFSLKIVLYLLKKRREIDLIHVHSVWRFDFITLLAAKILGIPVIIKLTLIGDDDPLSLKMSRSLIRKISGYSLRFFDRVVCISEAIQKSGLKARLDPERLVCIPNGVDQDIFRPVSDEDEKRGIRESRRLPVDDKILLFVGKVCYRKGADCLFRVWEKLKKGRNDVTLLIIGHYSKDVREGFDDPLLREFSYLLSSPGERIIFKGALEGIQDYIRAADLLFFPSRKEGLPNVVLESISCGVPVIARRLEGITDAVITYRGLGVLFEDDDAEGLCRLISGFLDNMSKSPNSKESMHNYIRKQYSISRIARDYLRLYNDIFSSKSGHF